MEKVMLSRKIAFPWIVCLSVVCWAGVAAAAVKLPAVFSDNMVLQRGQPAPVWGWADKGEEVTVAVAGQSHAAKAGEDGRWKVVLDKLDIGAPLEMMVKGSSGSSITLKNILVGEVWVCSGQSNMQMAIADSNNAREEIASADHPHIRLISVPVRGTQEPQQDFQGRWVECSPKTIATFSAAGYFFGRKLHQDLKVPIGLINCSWGGAACEAWAKRSYLEADPQYKKLLQDTDEQIRSYEKAQAVWKKQHNAWKKKAKAAKAAGKDPGPAPVPPLDPRADQLHVANCYNGMLLPIIPYAIRGAIWYQGETNLSRAYQYRSLFPAMIANWRADWGQGDFPFGFVQLAPFRYAGQNPTNFAELCEAQRMTLDASANTGMAVTLDIGDVKDIHPKNKQDVGKRLALWALAKVYGKDLVYSGPIYKSMAVEGNKIRLQFDHVGGGLISSDGKPLTEFTIAGTDQKFVPAVAEIDGNSIVVHSDKVAEPAAVRFAWRDEAVPNLANKEGLPASLFRTDTWKGVTETK
jgi:sialate O-acetylesterase